jgi:hypothetical protein
VVHVVQRVVLRSSLENCLSMRNRPVQVGFLLLAFVPRAEHAAQQELVEGLARDRGTGAQCTCYLLCCQIEREARLNERILEVLVVPILLESPEERKTESVSLRCTGGYLSDR